MTLSKTCLTHLTTYSVSDSVNSTGALALKGVPSGANSGTLVISAAYFNSREVAAAAAEAASRLDSGFSEGARVGVARVAGCGRRVGGDRDWKRGWGRK